MLKKTVNIIYIVLQILIFILGSYFFVAYTLNKNSWWLCETPFSNFTSCCWTLLYSFLPIIISKLKIKYTPLVKLFFLLAIMGHFIFGDCFEMYKTRYYSFFTHLLNSFVIGLIVYGIILRVGKKQGNLYLLFTTVACVCLIGVMWELYEFIRDFAPHKNMQRTINSITGEPFIGKRAIKDTMLDFIMDFSGGLFAGLFANVIRIKNVPIYKYFELKNARPRNAICGYTTYYEDNLEIKRINSKIDINNDNIKQNIDSEFDKKSNNGQQ